MFTGLEGSPNAEQPGDADNLARTANLLGALAMESDLAQQEAAWKVVGQAGAAAAALDLIRAYPGRTVERLRAPLGLSQPGGARLVARLRSAGWVERTGAGGRHGVALRLTPEGERVLDRMLSARRAALTEVLEPLSTVERDRLSTLLEKLLRARTGDRADLERLCRLCERPVCARCPVASAVA